MSSFLVEDKTINRVITYLAIGKDLEWVRREIKNKFGFDLDTEEGKSKLGDFMFKMNIKGTHQRYNGGVEDFRPFPYHYRCYPYFTPYSALKSLACWLYQCAEGNVTKSEEYKFFDKLQGDLAYHILCGIKEYETAEGWD